MTRPGGLVILATLTLAGCGGELPRSDGHALFDLKMLTTKVAQPTATEDFYLVPYPNDLRLHPDGTVDLSGYPPQLGILATYLAAFDGGTHGFGCNGASYFRFDAPLDPASLPADGPGSLAATSTAFVVDVTPGSPTFGQRTPVTPHFVATNYDVIGPNWLALLPVPGFPLRQRTTYAAVLTDGLKTASGGAILRASDLDAALGMTAYKPLASWLAAQPELAAHLVNAAVFTTADATSVMTQLRNSVYAQPAPTLAALTDDGVDKAGIDHVYSGTYLGPNFQQGISPFSQAGDGGQIEIDASGLAKLARTETLRVAMTIPEGTMPAAGWPVVIYAHGTGGDYKSFVRDGSGYNAAKVTASDGSVVDRLAMISIDQVLHGTRVPPGTSIDITFFNLLNIVAAHDNVKQGALDDFQLLRLVKSIDVAAAPGTNAPIMFDPTRIYFKGHSQGGLTGPLFLAAEPEVKAAVLSGAGGDIIFSLLDKKEPLDVPKAAQALLQDPLDEFHPVLSLLSNYFDDSDPINYVQLLFRDPPSGFAPKPIYQSLGLIDHYTPVPVIKALALAMGVQPADPMLDPIDDLALSGEAWGALPISQNVAGGQATGVLAEYNMKPGSDGHFVVFEVPAAIAQSNRFLATHSVSGIARLEAP